MRVAGSAVKCQESKVERLFSCQQVWALLSREALCVSLVVVYRLRQVTGDGQGVPAMPGDSRLGAVLRELRRSRGLTLASVARQAGCAESLVSYVESGRRQLHPWLASKLDEIYGTGGAVVSLGRDAGTADRSRSGPLVVDLPDGGVSMPLSRRDLLTALSIGVAAGPTYQSLERAMEEFESDAVLRLAEDAYAEYRVAIRMLPPSALMDGMIGKVVVLDGVRRRAGRRGQARCSRVQARYAESLSWLCEEAGDLPGALYWVDRTSQWGQAANWPGMSAYGFVRRAMLVMSFHGDGRRAVDHAQVVLDIPGISPRIKGYAARQVAFGHALAGDDTASCGALDNAVRHLSQPAREEDAVLGNTSLATDDLFAILRATCDVYAGRGDRVVPVLQPRLDPIAASNPRDAASTRAKLARAYANAGQPAEAAALATAALDDSDRIGSWSARTELRRALPTLNRWHGRDDIRAVLRRLAAAGP